MLIAREALAADAALVGTRRQVDSSVPVQVGLALERHAAVVALVRLVHAVLVHHVLLERQRLLQVQTAHPAHELVGERLELDVAVDDGAGRDLAAPPLLLHGLRGSVRPRHDDGGPAPRHGGRLRGGGGVAGEAAVRGHPDAVLGAGHVQEVVPDQVRVDVAHQVGVGEEVERVQLRHGALREVVEDLGRRVEVELNGVVLVLLGAAQVQAGKGAADLDLDHGLEVGGVGALLGARVAVRRPGPHRGHARGRRERTLRVVLRHVLQLPLRGEAPLLVHGAPRGVLLASCGSCGRCGGGGCGGGYSRWVLRLLLLTGGDGNRVSCLVGLVRGDRAPHGGHGCRLRGRDAARALHHVHREVHGAEPLLTATEHQM